MEILARRNFPAKLDCLSDCMEFISDCARDRGFGARRIHDIQLAAEEALVNIFSYAYPKGPGEVEITCRFDSRQRLAVELVDSGIPFDVLSAPEPDLTGEIEERAIGGLGVHFMKVLMDEVRYRREEGKNILILLASREERSSS
jgi:serine/threonine-protein kinase RsbW